jgi:hypothetical protein
MHIVAYHVSVSASLSLRGLDTAMLKHYMFERRKSVWILRSMKDNLLRYYAYLLAINGHDGIADLLLCLQW